MKTLILICTLLISCCSVFAQSCQFMYVGSPYGYVEICSNGSTAYPSGRCSYSGSAAMAYPCFFDGIAVEVVASVDNSISTAVMQCSWVRDGDGIYHEYCCASPMSCGPTGNCSGDSYGACQFPCFAPPGIQTSEPSVLKDDGSVSITIKEESNTELSFTAIASARTEDYCAPWYCNGNGCIRTCVTVCNGYTTQFKASPQSPDPIEFCN